MDILKDLEFISADIDNMSGEVKNTFARVSELLEKSRNEIELLRAAMPGPDNRGVSFGKHVWISWDKLCGWSGEDEAARQEFYKTSIIAKAIMEWRERLLAANHMPTRESSSKKSEKPE